MSKIQKDTGPDLETYLETRFNLLMEHIKVIENAFNMKLKEHDDRYQQRFEDQQMAISKSEDATEKRLESMNEFRKSLGDQASMLMPRSESLGLHKATQEKLTIMENRLNIREGSLIGGKEEHSNTRSIWMTWIAVVSVAIAAMAFMSKFLK